MPAYRVALPHRPALINKRQATQLLSSVNLVRRLLYAARRYPEKWPIHLICGRQTLINTADFEAAVDRILLGELPPLLPSEQKENSKRRLSKAV